MKTRFGEGSIINARKDGFIVVRLKWGMGYFHFSEITPVNSIIKSLQSTNSAKSNNKKNSHLTQQVIIFVFNVIGQIKIPENFFLIL